MRQTEAERERKSGVKEGSRAVGRGSALQERGAEGTELAAVGGGREGWERETPPPTERAQIHCHYS